MTRHIALAALIAATAACSEGGAPCDAEFGPWGDEMPDLDMQVGDTVEAPLADHFGPDECTRFLNEPYIFAESADPAAVAVSISVAGAAISERLLVIAAVAVADSVRVTVGIGDELIGGDSLPPHEFLVSVRPPLAGR